MIVKNLSLNSDVYRGKITRQRFPNMSIEIQKWISLTLKSPKRFTCHAFEWKKEKNEKQK